MQEGINNMNNILFKGIMPALITPFNDNQEINMEAVFKLIDWQLACGVNGFYTCGRTGEGPALRVSTRKSMVEAAVEATKGRGVIINHIGASNILDVIELTKHSQKVGVNAISSLVPNYTANYTEDELVEYYKIIADNTDLPILVYATPTLNASDLSKLMLRLMQIPNVIGLKFTRNNYFELQQIKSLNDGNINVINGPDETLLCGLAIGADGGIGATYNLMPDWFVKLYTAFSAGDLAGAKEYQYKINQVIKILIKYSKNGSLKAVKSALEMKGFQAGYAACPAGRFHADEAIALKADLEMAGICF